MARRRLRVEHPLLERLRRLDREVARQFPDAMFPGVWAPGLRLHGKLGEMRYTHVTPLNCFSFADTGGDGVHFGFLVRGGTVREDAPVVMTVPGAAANVVVGEDLFEFLCLGARRGYVGLEELAYQPEVAREAYTNPDWQPSGPRSIYVPNEQCQQVLSLMTSEFGLQPWPSPDRFAVLHERYAGSLELPAEA